MTIEIDEKLIGIWFVQLPTNGGHDDWQGGLSEAGPGEYTFVYRFRYADPLEPGADPFEYIDRKSWTSGTMRCSREDAISGVEIVATKLAGVARTTVCRVMMNPQRDVRAFMEEFARQPWAHVKIVSKEEYEREIGPVPKGAES